VRFGQANGQAHLRLGRTQVLTQASLKLVQPQGGKPNEGFYKFNIDFSSLLHGCEQAGMNVSLKEMKIDISQFIGKVLKSSRAIDRETLCIIQGRLVWSVQVDVFVLNEDGNLVDACFMAAVACLMNTRLPEVTMNGPSKLRINEDKVRNLNVHHIPVCTSFFFVDGLSSAKPIVDATAKEEKLAKSRLSICMNIFEDLCGMATHGSLEVDARVLLDCTKHALHLSKEATRRIREAFSQRHVSPLLDIQAARPSQIAEDNKRSALSFLQNLSMPEEVDAEMVAEDEVVEMLKQSKGAKPVSQQKEAPKLARQSSPDGDDEESRRRIEKLKAKHAKVTEINRSGASLDEELSLKSAIKDSKRKKKRASQQADE